MRGYVKSENAKKRSIHRGPTWEHMILESKQTNIKESIVEHN